MIHTIQVSNVKCDGCISNIKNGLIKVEGVHSIEVEENKKTVHVDAETDRQALVTKLAELGYPEV
ncbi:MAG: heavy-metal-associated domain-containing protein [Saprospiraceae bacterium]|nr:heavy-metal-associated domain-containing protein [Saprospiraceae bacterium]